MEFLDYLLSKYGYNEAVFLNDLVFKGYSTPWIKKAIANLCEEEKLMRFDKGVYYIPTETILGKSKLDPRKVIAKKYLNQDNQAIGYFSGSVFINMLGLSTQMPNTMEIYTNNERATVREVSVGKLKIILLRARANICNKNVSTMCFLKLMNSTDATFYDDLHKLCDVAKVNRGLHIGAIKLLAEKRF